MAARLLGIVGKAVSVFVKPGTFGAGSWVVEGRMTGSAGLIRLGIGSSNGDEQPAMRKVVTAISDPHRRKARLRFAQNIRELI